MPPLRKRYIRSWQADGQQGEFPETRARPDPLLFGLASVWNEDDIIWATVRNLFAQGADQVFVIDDESDDDTPAEARAAGAAVFEFPSSEVFTEYERSERIRSVISDQTQRAGGDVWWVVVDADEFPRGPGGTRIRDLVAQFPAWVDVVGSRVLDHMPSAAAPYTRGAHPVQSAPLARWYNEPFCPRGHWKHQLFRVRTAGNIYPMNGRHTVGTGDGRRAREARASLLMHHVPFRERNRTEAKLRALVASGGRFAGTPEKFTEQRIVHRLRIIDDVYNNRFDRIPNEYFGEWISGIKLTDWRDLVAESERVLPVLAMPGSR